MRRQAHKQAASRGIWFEPVLLNRFSSRTHLTRPAEAVGGEVLRGVDGPAAAGEGEALHVAALGAAQAEDALPGQHVQTDRVDALGVDDDEGRLVLGRAHGALQLDDLAHLQAEGRAEE